MHSSLQTFPIACVTPSQNGLIYSADSLASQYLTLMYTNLYTYLLCKYFMVPFPHRAGQRSALPSGCCPLLTTNSSARWDKRSSRNALG